MTRASDVEALKQLAVLGAMDDAIDLASGEFAALLDLSQQSASRRLIELTHAQYIVREMGVRKQRIRITSQGASVLRSEHHAYQRLFERRDGISLFGTVKTGLGEGRYYLSRSGYVSQFQSKLGWTPYPGTLNLELSGAEANKLGFLRRNPVHVIEAFAAEGRTFGGVICHPAIVAGTSCAAILPDRSHYTTTLEVIAPVCLRDALPCKDGDRLNVDVRFRPEAPAGKGAP